MKPLIVAGAVILAVILCMILGTQLVGHFQGELGMRQTGPVLTETDIERMNQSIDKRQEEEEQKYHRGVVNQGSAFMQEDAKMNVPVIREIEDTEAFDRSWTAKKVFSKVETWLTLGSIVFIGWMIFLRFRKR